MRIPRSKIILAINSKICYNLFTMKLALSQQLVQKLVLTPQMKQAIRILQQPLLELKSYLYKELEENPLLEDGQVEELEDSSREAEIDRLIELAKRDGDDRDDYFNPGYSQQELREKYNYRQSLITRHLTLQEHLLGQLRLSSIEEKDYKIGEWLIGNIGENGYFEDPLEETAKRLDVPLKDAERVLSLIQTFDPLGVGARNPKECLLIQLKAKGRKDSLAFKIVENHLSDLAKNRTRLIARRLKVSGGALNKALEEISSLEPKPGRSFSPRQTKYVIPDLMLKKVKDKIELVVNERELPGLKINRHYRNLLKQKNISKETEEFLRKKLAAALALIKAISQRGSTIKSVAECIVDKQSQFFREEKGHLNPLTLKQVAKIVGRNESTISRAVNNKYIQTPLGTFALKYFFNGSLKTSEGEMMSIQAIKQKIADLVSTEPPHSPLSDAKIVTLLQAQRINLARRTVTKYRKDLKIPSSSLRRK